MRKITIGFSYSKKKISIMSKIIKWYQKEKFSHTYLKINTSRGKTLIYEAVGSGVRFIGFDIWKKSAQSVFEKEIEVSDDVFNHILDFCMDNAGEDYSISQNLGIVIADLFHLDYNPLNSSGKNCSEIVLLALQEAGFTINKKPDLIMPVHIYKAIK